MHISIRWTQPESPPIKIPNDLKPDAILTHRTGLSAGLETAVRVNSLNPTIMYRNLIQEFDAQWYNVARLPYLRDELARPDLHAAKRPFTVITAEYGPLRVVLICAVLAQARQTGRVFRGRFKLIAGLYAELDQLLEQEFNGKLDDESRAAVAGKWEQPA